MTAIRLDLIDPPARDVRIERTEEDILRLAQDIGANGQINAISVIPTGARFECETGWTRCLSMRLIGRETIEADVRPAGDDWLAQRRRFSENHQRAQLSPIEEAAELDSMHRDHQLNVEQLARLCRRSETWVTERLALLDLPEQLQAYVQASRLSIGAAVLLGKITDDTHRTYLMQYAIDSGAAIHVIRQWVDQWRIAVEAGDAQLATLPPMPAPGQPIIIMIPCYRCAVPHDWRRSRTAQLCPICYEETSNLRDPTPPTRDASGDVIPLAVFTGYEP